MLNDSIPEFYIMSKQAQNVKKYFSEETPDVDKIVQRKNTHTHTYNKR